MLYEMGPIDPRALLASYAAADRTVYRNRIHLTQAEARALDEFVRWNYEPENRAYFYHYFRDNCSTRLRDALDLVLGETLRDAFAGRVTPRSYRWHTRRLVQEVGWVDQGLSFLLGTRGDLPRTEWEAMFIPMELLRNLEGVERPGRVEESPYLLGPRETLYRAARPPAPESPPGFSLLWPLLGLGIAGALGILATRADRHRWAGWGLALGVSLWGIFSAALGGILVMAWLTDHDFIQWNVNLLHLSPAGILLAGTSLVAVARPGGRAGAGAFAIALAIAAISVLGVLLEATPWIDQGNGEVLAVALPVNLAAAWALGIRARGSR
jgi:hypothetical protein